MKEASRMNSTVVLFGCLTALAVSWVGLSSSATALTAGDVLDKMNSDQSSGYFAGSVGMAALIAGASGKADRADCILNWYYEENGVEQIIQALDRFKEHEAQPVIYALINQACGE